MSKSENLCPRSSACCLITVIFCHVHHSRSCPSIFSTPFCVVEPVSPVVWGSADAGSDDDAPVSAGGGFGGRPFGLGSVLGLGEEEAPVPLPMGALPRTSALGLGFAFVLGAGADELLDAPVSAGGSWTAFIGKDIGSAVFCPFHVVLRCASR